MAACLIFPINNKGGVGKTSVLTDLCVTLSQRHDVGILDMDHQASLAGTLLGDHSLIDSDPSFEVRPVQLQPEASFFFINSLGKMGLDVQATRARLAYVPYGLVEESREARNSLEALVQDGLKGAQFVAIDIPPVANPRSILPYSVVPVAKALGKQALVIPLVVSTLDHNVIDIGLSLYRKVEQYLISEGIAEGSICPIQVLNKVPLKQVVIDGEIRDVGEFPRDAASKMSARGMLYQSPIGCDTINHINRKFTYNGRTFRSVSFPRMQIRDTIYSLFWSENPTLESYPHLVQLVEGNGFEAHYPKDPAAKAYIRGMRDLVNLVCERSGQDPKRNYVKRKALFGHGHVVSQTINDLRNFIEEYYSTGNRRYTDAVSSPAGGSSHMIWVRILPIVSLDGMASSIGDLERSIEANPQLGKEAILQTLKNGKGPDDEYDEEFFDSVYKVYNQGRFEQLEICYSAWGRGSFEIHFHHRDDFQRMSPNDQQGYRKFLEDFLTLLDSYSRKRDVPTPG